MHYCSSSQKKYNNFGKDKNCLTFHSISTTHQNIEIPQLGITDHISLCKRNTKRELICSYGLAELKISEPTLTSGKL